MTWQIKAAIAAVVALALMSVGGLIGSWRAHSAANATIEQLHKDVSDRDARILQIKDDQHKMELAVADANKALAVAAEQTKTAEAVQRQAQLRAEDQVRLSSSRLDKLTSLAEKASGCAEVLQKYWEMRE